MKKIPEKRPFSYTRFLWLGNLLFLIIVVLIALHWGDWRVFLKLLSQVQLKWLGLAVIFQFGTYLCVTLIWKIVLKSCNISILSRHLFALSIAKLFSDQTIPSFGLSGSLLAMRGFIRRKSPASAAAAAVMMNTVSRYFPYFVLFNIAIAILWKNHMLNKGLQYLAAGFSILILFLLFITLTLTGLIINKRIPYFLRFIGKFKSFVETIQGIPEKIFKKKSLWALAFTANAIIFLLDSGTLWILLTALHTFIPFSHAFACFMISSVVADLAIMPGKIGVFEGSLIALLHLFKIPIEHAIAAIVLFRGLTYWLPMIPGFFITRREF